MDGRRIHFVDGSGTVEAAAMGEVVSGIRTHSAVDRLASLEDLQ